MTLDSITIDPPLDQWLALAGAPARGEVLGRTLDDWRRQTRSELGLPVDRPIIATGHQPTLWHAGILTKYLAVDAVVRSEAGVRARAASLSVIVDQDVVQPGAMEVPAHDGDGRLVARRLEFMPAPPAADVPSGLMPAFVPRVQTATSVEGLPELPAMVERVRAALAGGANGRSAAAQVGAALTNLMRECCDIAPMPMLLASELMRTTLCRVMLEAMARDPQHCAAAYNAAAAAQPAARIAPLAIGDDYVELPVWRVRRDDGSTPRRIRGYDADVERWLEISDDAAAPTLLPRALLMTALLRMAACDLFIHGTGGAVYDHVMEQWIGDWLGVRMAPMAAVTATLRLPLMDERDLDMVSRGGLEHARNRKRRLAHDPGNAGDSIQRPGVAKQAMLRAINGLPRRSVERRAAFFDMHRRLDEMRASAASATREAEGEVERLEKLSRDAAVALRRDWAFPLYQRDALDVLARAVRARAG